MRKESFSQCVHLVRVKLPQEIRFLDDRVFYRCRELAQIEFPFGLTHIGEEAFYQTGLSQINFPGTLETLGDSAFLKCNNLEFVHIPSSVKHIGKWVFHGATVCEPLRSPMSRRRLVIGLSIKAPLSVALKEARWITTVSGLNLKPNTYNICETLE